MTVYRDSVQQMCDALGIQNPIREEDLKIKAVSFSVKGEWVKVDGTDMNRAGRLFFQFFRLEKDIHGPSLIALKDAGRSHFGGMWHDAEERGRAMLIAFKASACVRVHKK